MKNKILYITPLLSSFINNDIQGLSKEYSVRVNTYDWSKKSRTILYMISQKLFILRHLRSTKAIFISFGGYWALVPTMMGKIMGIPVYIILNGTDCASIPSLHYGNLRKPLLKAICGFCYRHASMLLPVSDSLISIKNTFYSSSDEKEYFQGYRHFFPAIQTKNKTIYNGFDTSLWHQLPEIKKEENSFIAVFSQKQYILKGGDLIIEVAKQNPNYKFYIAGCTQPSTVDKNSNVIFLDRLTSEELKQYYSKCQFVLQLSIFEGFGCSLCEAMLCECIPIGSSVNMIPEIIGNAGFVVNERNAEQVEKAILSAIAIEDKTKLGKMARQRITENYSLEKRTFSLLETINNKN